ncbi:MAG: DNA polymerase IV [Phycisphaerae bacterium]
METLKKRSILHIDMDAFFASIEQEDHPQLQGKPVLVGGSAKERGVVAAASYEARRFGCHSAMPMATAMRLCPQAVIMPGRMQRYAEVSEQIFEIMGQFTPEIEPLSIDEAFLDVTGCEKLFGPAEHIAREIKRQIHQRTHLTASVGVAPNKLLAKLASDLKKPDGLVIVPVDRVEEFLDPLAISRLWGVGKATLPRFEELGLRTFGDVRKLSLEAIRKYFGSAGEDFYRFVRGIDDRPVTTESETRSISTETTFAADVPVRELEYLRGVLLDQTDQVARRLRRQKLLARTVTIKIRSGNFTTITRSVTMESPTDQTQDFWNAAVELFRKWGNEKPFPVRLLGMGVSSLRGPGGQQLMLFDQEENLRRQQLDRAMDEIRDKFGGDAIKRGMSKP